MGADRPISENDLHAYVDNALSPGWRAKVEQWLARNPAGAGRVERFLELRAALRQALGPIAEQPIPAQLDMIHLLAGRHRSGVGLRRAVAAACLCLGLGCGAGWALRGLTDAASCDLVAVTRDAAVAFGPQP